MPLYIKDPNVFASALLAYVMNGGMSNGTKRDPSIEKLIVNDPALIELYVWRWSQNTNKPMVWPEALNSIMASGTAKQLVYYIDAAMIKPTPEIQARIMQDPAGIAYYESRLLTDRLWKEALPAIAKSPQSLIAYLNEKSDYTRSRLPELEPYIVKLNDPRAAAGYLEYTDFDNKIIPAIYGIIERDQALLKTLLDNYVASSEDEEISQDQHPFIERAVMILDDTRTALAYVRFIGDRVKPFEPWLLDHAVKEQDAEDLVVYSLNALASEYGYGTSSIWTGCIPTIVKYSSPQQLLDFAAELTESADYNDASERFLVQLEKVIAPIMVNAVISGTIAAGSIANYSRNRDNNGWPAFDRLLQKQSPTEYKEYIKNL
jgi:hypothetical protein